MKSIILILLCLLTVQTQLPAAPLFGQGASWRWRTGTSEASAPVEAWRAITFADASFTTAPAPFWYGDVLTGGTQITGMSGVYSCIFLRKTFVVSDVSQVATLQLGAMVDDGFVAWINGTEVQRVNMPGAAGSAVTISTLADNAAEPPPFKTYTLPNPAAYLVTGENVIAVQVFQSSLTSSDLGFDASLDVTLVETIPPTIASVTPAAGTITNLTAITITFSEAVSGVDATDLLVNGASTLLVTPVNSSTYTFTFEQPAEGNVSVSWRNGHGIADQAVPPNPFNATGPGATWMYNLVDNTLPRVDNLSPAAGATVRDLSSINVLFSEPVTGVNAADLLINNGPATGLTPLSSRQYLFTFSQPATGQVQLAWAPSHGILDQAAVPNAFAGGNWTYQLNPNAADAAPYISEFMASNTRTLADETGQFQDWIEIYNPSSLTVNLDGWSLTDAAGNPTKWRFPATNLAGGAFIVVFASGNDRRIPGARLHTSFQLQANGEYLALIKPDGTIASEYEPVFPPQVPDISHGFAQSENGPLLTAGAEGVYFTTPTPGAPNLGGVNRPGPVIENVVHTPNVPLDNEDLVVTARVRPSFLAVGSVSMRYRIMFGSEVTTPMFDDGAHGDGAAGDGVYGASIPANLSTRGEMIRYFITATDVSATVSRWPIYTIPTEHEEYLGTVVDPSYVTSKVPIFHLFAPPTILQPGPTTSQIGADSEGGGRVAIYYDGEFYDNVYMELRGNTSAGLNKKAHRIEFNRGHEFRHAGPGGRTRKSSFLAEHLDPSYLRQHLSFWFLTQIGVKAPYDYPVRLQLNGAFYQLAFHNDVIGQEQVERLGYDPKGALYKAVGTFVTSRFSTGVFQKLEPDETPVNYADYTELAAGIAETSPVATRRATVFDRLDLPQVINHLAGVRWCSENDDVWANMSMYRDTFGDKLWRNIPFDMNASWGQLYGGSNPLEATVDNSKSHPLYGGSTTAVGNWNRLYDVIVTLPETRAMLLRRQRSIMNQMIQPPGTPVDELIIENYIKHMTNLISVEANLDRAKWGFSPWASGKTFEVGVGDLLNQFVGPRRNHWYATHSITNTSRPIGINSASNAGIPLDQPGNVSLQVAALDFNPASGLQAQEYVCLTNATTLALDISGWKLDGGVDFKFKIGTVVPPNSVLYVSPDVVAFRGRTAGPRGGQGLFVVGPYKGQLSARGETLTLLNALGVPVHTFTFPGAPSLAERFLRISELMYHPSAHSTNPDPEQFEYIELHNTSTSDTLNLAGVRFINGVEFDFSGSAVTSLAPGAHVLVVKNMAAFAARYGNGLPVAGQYVGNLDNAGERIQLLDAANEEIHDFSYNNSWHRITDGLGFSLAVVDESAEPDLWDSKTQWRPSGIIGGSPGIIDSVPPVFAPIIITEALTHTDLPDVDQIELFNPTANTVNIGGWWLSDDFINPLKFRIPAGTTIAGGGYLVFSETNFNLAGSPTAFSLSSKGDEVYVFSGDGVNLTGYYQGYSYGAAATGVSFGRYVNSQTNVHFVAQSSTTLGGANSGPKVGPVVISEINYRPVDLPDDQDNVIDEYVELSNITGSPVVLFDPANSLNTWRLRGGVDFNFPLNVTLPANGFILLVSFDPANASVLASFRSRFNVPVNVPVFGPYDGKLDNSGERVRLLMPDAPDLGEVPYVLVDEVDYGSKAPWPSAPDGVGPSLQRIVGNAYGNDPVNWTGVGPSPGSSYVAGGTLPVVVTQPVNTVAVAGRAAMFTVTVSGSAPLFYQWRWNGRNIYGANNPVLTIQPVTPNDVGAYSCIIFNSAGSTESTEANLTVVLPPFITQQPVSRAVYIKPDAKAANLPNGTNVTFTVAATSGNSGLSYQWRFNGVNIPGATSPSYTVLNVQLTHEGDYTCVVTDSVDSVESEPARLTPWLQPVIVFPPVNQTVTAGGKVTMSVAVTGNPLPMEFSWRRNIGSIEIANSIVSSRTNLVTLSTDEAFLNLVDGMASTNYAMRIVIKNDAHTAPGINTVFNITVVADTDRDGISDTQELALGLDPNNSADAAGDLDNDGMSNRAEAIAGTDATNSLSYLKIEQSVGPNMATVQFGSVSNRTYSIQFTDNLNISAWNKLTDMPARRTNYVHQMTDPNWTTNRFYRVVTPWQP